MTARGGLAPFGLESRQLLDDPYPIYAQYRRDEPVHWGLPSVPGAAGAWYLFGHGDCEEVLADPRFGKDVFNRTPAERFAKMPAAYQAYAEQQRNGLVVRDPPEHTRLRTLVNGAFTRNNISHRRPDLEAIAEDLLDDMARKGDAADIVADYAVPMPVSVIGDLIGIPRADRRRLKQWSVLTARSMSGSMHDLKVYSDATAASLEFGAYIETLAAKRRAEPQDDLLSALLAVESAGDRLSMAEVISLCRLLLVGGHETTTNLFSHAFVLLQRDPAQLAELGDDEQRWSTAVGEVLRYESPVQFTFRLCYADVEMGGRTIKAGERIQLMLGSANRDGTVFREPDRFKVQGSGGKPIHFGRGPHYCIGANLGPLEACIAIPRLFKRFPRIKPLAERFAVGDNMQFRGFLSVPVSLSGKG